MMTRRHCPTHGAFGRSGARPPTATLAARDAPEHGEGVRYLEIDCPHGRTQSAFKNAAPPATQVAEADAVKMMLLRHYLTERCACTAELRRRYGMPP